MYDNLVVSSRGQITLPASIRKRLGIKPGSVVTIEERNGDLVLRLATTAAIDCYTEEQIAQWNNEDQLDEAERRAILERLNTAQP